MESLGALQVLGFDPDSFITKQGVTKVAFFLSSSPHSRCALLSAAHLFCSCFPAHFAMRSPVLTEVLCYFYQVVNLDVVCLHLAGMMGMEENVLAEGGYSEELLRDVKNFAGKDQAKTIDCLDARFAAMTGRDTASVILPVGVTRVLLRYSIHPTVLRFR